MEKLINQNIETSEFEESSDEKIEKSKNFKEGKLENRKFKNSEN